MTQPQHLYPVTPRRAFVDLAEAVRVQPDHPQRTRVILQALANLPVNEVVRTAMAERFFGLLADTFGSPDKAERFREDLADCFALILDGFHEQFDVARFVHHACSDIEPDADAEGGGKWSFNYENPVEALKVTIQPE